MLPRVACRCLESSREELFKAQASIQKVLFIGKFGAHTGIVQQSISAYNFHCRVPMRLSGARDFGGPGKWCRRLQAGKHAYGLYIGALASSSIVPFLSMPAIRSGVALQDYLSHYRHERKMFFLRLADETFNFNLPLFLQQDAVGIFIAQIVAAFPGFFEKDENSRERLDYLEHYAVSYFIQGGEMFNEEKTSDIVPPPRPRSPPSAHKAIKTQREVLNLIQAMDRPKFLKNHEIARTVLEADTIAMGVSDISL
ncbi:hypothetical protein MVEN_01925500 [Mycena venus]|uniref:Uncharacterized protein n=1 Tax=Mycena venus TaxID=2733690 RepID=A0A8H7CJK0_9AGAR|nr:hypothetical protein MVEN_01925500 [Mycena venus]